MYLGNARKNSNDKNTLHKLILTLSTVLQCFQIKTVILLVEKDM